MLSYIMSSKSENGELEYYNAKEYYRVRHSTERMFLLNFDMSLVIPYMFLLLFPVNLW